MVSIVIGMLQPLATRFLIDDVLIKRNATLLGWLVGALAGLIVLRGGLGVLSSYQYIRLGQMIMVDLRRELYTHTLGLRMREIQHRPTGEIMSRILNDVGALQMILTSFVLTLVTNTFMLAVSSSILLYMDWRLALVGLATMPGLVLLVKYYARPVKEASHEVQRRIAQMSSFLQESMQSLILVRIMGRERQRIERYDQILATHTQTVLRSGMISTWSSQLIVAVGAMGPVILLWFGSIRVIDGLMTTGTLIAFFSYLSQMYGPLQGLTQLNVSLQGAMASVERVFGYLDLPPDPAERDSPLELAVTDGRLQFDGVSFSHEDRFALRDVTVEFEPSTITAIVGRSGAGKSTLAWLLIRMYDATGGRILIDGQDISQVKPSSLRRAVTIIPQDVFLFNDTILENVRFARPDATAHEVEDACRVANIHDFVLSLPDGYETRVGERGLALSGGERQRLAMARAALCDPKVLILDEATSSLDTVAEQQIWEALEQVAPERTTLVITHRPSSFSRADRIVVMAGGRVVDVGSHEQLMVRCADYVALQGEPDSGCLEDES